MSLDEGLDTGPVHLEHRIDVGDKTFATLLEELASLGAHALTEVLDSPDLLANSRAQRGDATYAAKLTKADRHLTPSVSAVQLARIVRVGQAFAFVEGRRLLVESAAVDDDVDGVAPGSIALRDGRVLFGASEGSISLDRVRPESAKSMSAIAWWSGARLDPDVVRWT
jgi:methionyl-tRNA formyltransferase